MATIEETTTFSAKFLRLCTSLIDKLDIDRIETVVTHLVSIRQGQGRLFVVGSGGGAGHASHATCDFRKICGLEAYAPYDNVSELTARVNDDGWDTSLAKWLEISRLTERDGLFVFSVGGGSQSRKVSMNLVNAIDYARSRGSMVLGVVGRDGGYTATVSDSVIVIPAIAPELVTPLTEGFQAVLWHLIVSHPKLQMMPAKWESTASMNDGS